MGLTFKQAINDLAVSPINPRILASASADYGVRIWSLDPAHAKHPTAVIFFGEGGHRENVLSLVSLNVFALQSGVLTQLTGLPQKRQISAFRRNGQQGLHGNDAPSIGSGCSKSGKLTAIQWVVPDDADTLAGKDKPLRIHYPHFSSADIHAEFVDW